MTDNAPGLFLRINELARATAWLHPLMVGWATCGVAVALIGWVILRRMILRVVVRLTNSRLHRLMTAEPLPVCEL